MVPMQSFILDLEDSIAPDQKAQARRMLADAAQTITGNGGDVLVRVNAESLEEDIAAAALACVNALIVPKVDSPEVVVEAAALLERKEAERGLKAGAIHLLAQIEDVRALPNLDVIANASPRLLGMSLGSEDFSASASMQPLPETLYAPNQQVAFACRRAGILPFGFPASITLFEDQSALETAATQAANMGFVGAFCIHPNQVSVLNQALTPSTEAVVESRLLLEAYEYAKAEGAAVFAHRGKMVDLPVILRARALVARAETIAAKSAD